jgi:hypothetical protein
MVWANRHEHSARIAASLPGTGAGNVPEEIISIYLYISAVIGFRVHRCLNSPK